MPGHALAKEDVPAPRGALALLHQRDFRIAYSAIVSSELGDAFQYIALMWFALEAAGPLGVLAVRLADSVPALIFGFHGGLLADRLERRRTMIAADLVRGAVLVPVALAGLLGHLPLWALVGAAFVLTAATSYFDPAYGALLPGLVGRESVQQANGLVRATGDAVGIGGWALAAVLLTFMPLSAFFAINALSYFISALLLARIHVREAVTQLEGTTWTQVRAGFAALRLLPVLAVAVAAVGVAITIESGTWMVGVPDLVRNELGGGASSFAMVMVGYALGSVSAGLFLTRHPLRRKARASLLAWCLYFPAYLLMALAGSVAVACVGAVCAGVGQGSAIVLVNSAAQEQVPDATLGRVIGLISLVHRGAHATGLLFVAPLFAIVDPRPVFLAAALAAPVVGLGGLAAATALSRRADATRVRGSNRNRRS